jgi:hypothetical protein
VVELVKGELALSHFPVSIFDLSFAIAQRHEATMKNVRWKLENEK